MEATEFKLALKENINFLTGKQITVSLVSKSGTQKFTFEKLKNFGLKVLELEALGAGFGFSTVENNCTIKKITSAKEFFLWSNYGVWTKINITASII